MIWQWIDISDNASDLVAAYRECSVKTTYPDVDCSTAGIAQAAL